MSHTSHDNWSKAPVPELQAHKPTQKSIFWKLGERIGGVFVSAKNAAKQKYLDVTKGINQRIEAEQESIQEEIFSHLAAQAEEFEQEIRQRRKRWFWITFILVILALGIGAVSALFYLI